MFNQKTHFLQHLEFFLYFTFDDFFLPILSDVFGIPIRLEAQNILLWSFPSLHNQQNIQIF